MGDARPHRENSSGGGVRPGEKRLWLKSNFPAPNAGSTSPATNNGRVIRSNARPAPPPSPCPRLFRLRRPLRPFPNRWSLDLQSPTAPSFLPGRPRSRVRLPRDRSHPDNGRHAHREIKALCCNMVSMPSCWPCWVGQVTSSCHPCSARYRTARIPNRRKLTPPPMAVGPALWAKSTVQWTCRTLWKAAHHQSRALPRPDSQWPPKDQWPPPSPTPRYDPLTTPPGPGSDSPGKPTPPAAGIHRPTLPGPKTSIRGLPAKHPKIMRTVFLY